MRGRIWPRICKFPFTRLCQSWVCHLFDLIFSPWRSICRVPSRWWYRLSAEKGMLVRLDRRLVGRICKERVWCLLGVQISQWRVSIKDNHRRRPYSYLPHREGSGPDPTAAEQPSSRLVVPGHYSGKPPGSGTAQLDCHHLRQTKGVIDSLWSVDELFDQLQRAGWWDSVASQPILESDNAVKKDCVAGEEM